MKREKGGESGFVMISVENIDLFLGGEVLWPYGCATVTDHG